MGKKNSQPEREWDGIVRRSIDLRVRSIDENERTIEVVASTKDLDAHGDIVEQSFDLKRFKNNPVILWMHNAFGFLDGSSAKDFMPIGKAVDVGITGGELHAKVQFLDVSDAPPEEEQIVKMAWRRVKQGVLRAVSIGFKPGEVSEEKKDGRKVYHLKDNELYEISFVPMGANPNAVAKAVGIQHEHFSRLCAAKSAETEDHDMTLEIAQKRIAELEAEIKMGTQKLDDSDKALKAAQTALAEKDQTIKTLTDEKAAADAKVETVEKQVKDLESSLAEKEVDALVGKKITPAEKDEFVELRKSNPDLFLKMVEKRGDLSSLSTKFTNPVKPEGKGAGSIAERAAKAANA